MVFDVWAGSADVRQAVYVEDFRSRTFRAVFIDNGHLFGGPKWRFDSRPGTGLCLERDVYAGLFDSAAIAVWIARIEATIPRILPDLVKSVPSEWYKGSIAHLRDALLRRAESLKSLFWDEMMRLRQPLDISSTDSHERTPASSTGILRERTGGSRYSVAVSEL
jgi:hypothetical protein